METTVRRDEEIQAGIVSQLNYPLFYFIFFGGVVVVLLYLFMTVIKLNLILKYSVLILKFSNIVHIHNKKLKRV